MRADKLRVHPIRLLRVSPKKLCIEANEPPDPEKGIDELNNVSIRVGHTEYDKKKKQFAISVQISTSKDPNLPYSLEVDLRAIFEVDEKKFDVQYVEDWARRGSIYVLAPFVREYMYWLTSKCGFKPILLPLLEVPTFKATPKVKTTRKKAVSSTK